MRQATPSEPSATAATAGDALRVDLITSRDDVEHLADAWDALSQATVHASPLSTHAWFTSYLDELRASGDGRHSAWSCFAASAGGRLVGVMPVQDSRRLGGLMGRELRVPGGYYIRSGEPLLAEDRAGEALKALVDAAGERYPRASLEFGGVREHGATFAGLGSLPSVRARRDAKGALIRIDGTAESWLSTLSRNHRKHLNRGGRRLEEAYPGSVAYRVVGGPDAARMLDDFVRVEASGWKGGAGMALFATPSQLRLYRRMCERFAARGWLEWHILEAGGNLIVIDMWIRVGRTMAGLFTAYDEEFAVYSPGALRLRRSVEEAFASGTVDLMDVLVASPWTQHWSMETYDYYRVLVGTGNPLALWMDDAAVAARRAGRAVLPTSTRRRVVDLRRSYARWRVRRQ